MEKKLLFLLVNLFLLCGGALAQTKVTGTVVSLEDVHDVAPGTITIKPKQTRGNAPKFNNNNNNEKI